MHQAEQGLAELKRAVDTMIVVPNDRLLSVVGKGTSFKDALKKAVKTSLQDLCRALNGDAKTEPTPLFKVDTVLEGTRMDFKPTMNNLKDLLQTVCRGPLGLSSSPFTAIFTPAIQKVFHDRAFVTMVQFYEL